MDGTDRAGPPPRLTQVPIRTCVGCRQRDSWSALLRVTAREDDPGAIQVVPDVRRRLGGRGAWLHPELDCLEQAVRRRAFARALRVQAAVDVEPLTAYLGSLQS